MSVDAAPVGIVGAGPVGLSLALRLAALGVRSVILERDPELRKQGSKACLIQGDVLEVLDKFGCAQQIADEGVTWTVARTYVRGKVIRSAHYPRPIGFGPFVNISQYRIEQILAERAATEPHTEIRWSHTVTGLRQDDDGVRVTADTPGGPQELAFRYLVGCDGVRSSLRELSGVRWTGYSHRDRFLITDIKAELPLAQERHFHYDPPFNPGRQLVMHPQPDNVWRIDWQLPPDADIAAEEQDGRLDRRIRDVIGDIPYEIDWMSTYRFHQRVVDRFRVGRLFLAGDAAHALPPYGSRGMNSGIQDADNLAWKLAAVLGRGSGEDLLETYHTERYAAAVENLAITEATIRFMVPPSRARQWARTVLLALAPRMKSVRGRVNSGRMAEPFNYRNSPLVDTSGGHPLAGAFAPDGYVRGAAGRTRLRRAFGDGFTVLHLADDALSAARFAAAVSALPSPVPLRTLAVLPDGPPGPDGQGSDAGQVVVDADGAVLASYGPGPAWFLIRPDGHVAATGAESDLDALTTALRRCAGASATAGRDATTVA